MAEYQVQQISQGEYEGDLWSPLTRYPSICDDGRRAVFAQKIDPPWTYYSVWLYDRSAGSRARQLITTIDGTEERYLVSSDPQISGDGRWVVFYSPGFYAESRQSGIYLYEVATGRIRLVVPDQVPRHDTGAEMIGRPGLSKRIASRPSISADGSKMTYIWAYYRYVDNRRTNWVKDKERLMCVNISGDIVTGGTMAEVPFGNAHGSQFQSQRISGDGRTIAFYADGSVEGLNVENLEMPPYETDRYSDLSAPTTDIYCYVLRVGGTGGENLMVVPHPDCPSIPLVVAHPYLGELNSFNRSNVTYTPPSICRDGSRIALNAGFEIGSEDTGVYVFEPRESITRKIITFTARPGAGPGNQTLITGAIPSISADGRKIAYLQREVTFPEGYGDADGYEGGSSYCPYVSKDEIVVRQIPLGESSALIEAGESHPNPIFTSRPGVAISQDGNQVIFISRCNMVRNNPDLSHEAFFATNMDE